MNIFLSICGHDENFEIYDIPKPHINILGKPMMNWVIDNLILKPNDHLYIIHTKHDTPYIKKTSNTINNIHYVRVDGNMYGPVDTYFRAINETTTVNLNIPCIFIDCDTFFVYDVLQHFRTNKQNLVYCFRDIDNQPIYSYVKTRNGNISSIKEKEPISNIACAGCYCFKTTNLFHKTAKRLLDNDKTIYVSHIVSDLIKSIDFKIHILNSDEFHCLGNPNLIKIFSESQKHIKSRFCFSLSSLLTSDRNMEYVRYLKSHGHTIIIDSDMKAETQGLELYKLLEKFNIPYDEVYMNRPKADFYITNNRMFDKIEQDTGFYRTSVKERSFNSIDMTNVDVIVKHSQHNALRGEIYWYQNIPKSIDDLFPKFYGSDSTSYTLEKIKGVTLSHLYINDLLTIDLFKKLLKTMDRIHNSGEYDEDHNIYANYCDKLEKRYNSFDYSQFPDSFKLYKKLYAYFKEYELSELGSSCVIHGDPVFTNILLDKNNNFKFIDMRGQLGTQLSIYGDRWYDYAKIYQSLIGYDHIIHDKVLFTHHLKNYFEKYIIEEFSEEVLKYIKMITKSLLFSLIPFHEKYQYEFYALIREVRF